MSKDELEGPLALLISDYGSRAGTDTAGAVRDVLTELMHHCDRLGLDFDERLVGARTVYAEEVGSSRSHRLGVVAGTKPRRNQK